MLFRSTGQQHKVRFQDSEENNDDDDDDNEGEDETELVANCLTSLKIKGRTGNIIEIH